MQYEKIKRTQDRELLDCYREKPCIVCGKTETTIGHHIISKGAGGPDELWNLLPLCYKHHDEIHRTGMNLFFLTYGRAKAYIQFWGWSWDEELNKWLRPYS